jgi:hypothetical protein
MLADLLTDRFKRHFLCQAVGQKPFIHAEMMPSARDEMRVNAY